MTETASLYDYLDRRRKLIVDEIKAMVPADTPATGGLYAMMLDYPLRGGKAIRPALSISVCRGAGGSLSAVLPSAVVLELYHNAFLIHDDVEDRSEKRRSEDTLNRIYGIPTAVNVGDGMLALAIRPLLDNISHIGLGKALKIFRVISRMARQTAEGQMIELDWIRSGNWSQNNADYIRLVHKKTAWYSFVAPVMVGAIAAGMSQRETAALGRMAIPLGIAFQIQDDVLNLGSDEESYSKDYCADLWEGKHTLILIHALRSASARDREKALRILRKPQPVGSGTPFGPELGQHPLVHRELERVINNLIGSGDLTSRGGQKIRDTLQAVRDPVEQESKTPDDVGYLRRLVEQSDSLTFAWNVAQQHARHFNSRLQRLAGHWPPSEHRDFLFDLGEFTVSRAT